VKTFHPSESQIRAQELDSQPIVYSSYRPDGRWAVTSPPPSRCTYSIPARGGGGTKRGLPLSSLSTAAAAGGGAVAADDNDDDDDGVFGNTRAKRGGAAARGANPVGARRAKRSNPAVVVGRAGDVAGPDAAAGGDVGGGGGDVGGGGV